MTPDILEVLNSDPVKEGSDKDMLGSLLDQAKRHAKFSRSRMSKYYDQWDFQDSVYRGEIVLTDEEKEEMEEGKPTRQIVPNTFSQAQVFISFLFLLFKQNRTFFELTATGDEDDKSKKEDAELILEHDLRKSRFNGHLYQGLSDIAIRGCGFWTPEWCRKTAKLKVQGPAMQQMIMGVPVNIPPVGASYQDYLKYEGNEVRAISPYRILPDLSRPLSEMERGRFCGEEEEYSMSELRSMADAKEIGGVDKIQPLPDGWAKERGGITRTNHDFNRRSGGDTDCGHATNDGMVLVTKMKMWITPYKFEISTGKKLGPEEFPVLYKVWYANDNTLLLVEPAEEWHNSFGITQAQFTPDMHHTINMGLAQLIYRLQDVLSWFINAHMKSVRQVIRNRLVINTDAVESRSLDSDFSDIYLKKGFGRRPVTDAVSQLQVQDVTSGFMADAQVIGGLIQMVTGVNDNLQGAPNPRRVSAQENRVQTGGAAGRMKLHGHLIFESGLAPLAEMMLSNSRQSISPEMYARIVGSAKAADPQRYITYKGTPEEVIGGDDFFTFDSTLASEKGFAAQSLQDLFSTMLQVNPQMAMMLAQTVDPMAMLNEIQYLRTGSTISRFQYPAGKGPVIPPVAPQVLPNPVGTPTIVNQ